MKQKFLARPRGDEIATAAFYSEIKRAFARLCRANLIQSAPRGLGALACAVTVAACSSSSSPKENAVGLADAATEAASPAEESFTILVVKGEPPFNEVAPNVTILFDKPGGERIELQSGTDGRVTVDGIAWSKGPAAFSVLPEGRAPTSYVELTKAVLPALNSRVPEIAGVPKHDVAVFTSRPPPQLPSLSGAISHARGPRVYVSPTAFGGPYSGASDSYALSVQRNAPFSLITLELAEVAPPTVGSRGRESKNFRWSKTDVPPATNSSFNVDLDLATELTPVKVRGIVVIPGGKNGSLGGQSTFAGKVSSHESRNNTILGLPSRFDVSADESAFELDYEYVKLDGVTPVVTYSIGQPDFSASTLTLFAWPSEGFVVDGFLTLPVISGPSTRSLTAPFALEGLEPDSMQNLDFYDAKTYRWKIEVPPGVTTFTPPRLDGALKAAVGKPTGVLLTTYASYDPATRIFQRDARTGAFKVE